MTEAQIWSVVAAAFVTAAGILGATIRWAVRSIEGAVAAFRERIGRALDDNTKSNHDRVNAERTIVERFIVLETKIDRIDGFVRDYTGPTPVRGVPVFEPDEHPSQRRRIDPPSERRRAQNGHVTEPGPDLSVPYHYTTRPRR